MTAQFKVLLILILGAASFVAFRTYDGTSTATSAAQSHAEPQVLNEPSRPAAAAFMERRTALVIGNSAYGGGASLPNAGNDARAMAEALRQTGFKVTLRLDVDQAAMEQAIQSFADALRTEGGVALFYYSGHAFQAQGRSFLAPVGAVVASETDARFKTVDVEYVMGHLEEAGSRMKIVILDACRDNPFTRSFRTRGQSLQGLSRVDAPTGTLIAYATSPGKTAADGTGQHSPYTQALLQVMRKPGLALEQTFKEVRIRVAESTSNTQIPWESSSLLGEFYFLPTGDEPNVANAATAPAPTAPETEYEPIHATLPATSSNDSRPSSTQAQPPLSPLLTSKPPAAERSANKHLPAARVKRKATAAPVSSSPSGSNDDYFANKAKDIETFLENPKTRRTKDSSPRNGDPYFKNLSSDMERFLRR